MGMIKEEGAAYFARERGNKVEVGLYLEHIIEERGIEAFPWVAVTEHSGAHVYSGK